MRNYTTWLKTTAICQFLIAAMHAATLFIDLPPNNETEKQLSQLMGTYKFDLGAGFHRTMNELTTALSSCLSLLCLFAGLISLYLMRKKVAAGVIDGIININLVVFGIFFVITVMCTFLLPVIQIGLILLLLALSKLTLRRNS